MKGVRKRSIPNYEKKKKRIYKEKWKKQNSGANLSHEAEHDWSSKKKGPRRLVKYILHGSGGGIAEEDSPNYTAER